MFQELKLNKINRGGEIGNLAVVFRHNIRNVIPWVPVETLLQPLLIQMMTNEANRATQNKKTINCSNVDVLVCFFPEIYINKENLKKKKH